MRVVLNVLSGVLAACVTLAPAAAQTFDARTDPTFQKALGVNRGLQSYTARIDVDTRVLFGRFGLQGTVYHRDGQSIVVFDRVPAIARGAVSSMPTISGPGDWTRQFARSVAARTAETTTFRLIPLATKRVRSIDAVVSNASGLVLEYAWSNVDGQTITSDQTYETIDGYELVRSIATTIRGGFVQAKSTSVFTSYALNATVPDAILAATPSEP